MLMLILIIVILITCFCEIQNKKDSWSCWDLSRIITIPVIITCLIFIIIFAFLLAGQRIIDKKIKLYQIQNKEIEQKVEITVKNYMNYEKDTYKEFKTDNYIQLVNLYPELKSDKLVQKQLDLYMKNNDKIIELKQERLNKTLYKWWIYFGK